MEVAFVEEMEVALAESGELIHAKSKLARFCFTIISITSEYEKIGS